MLRSLVRATTYDELHHREDAAVGMRATALRAHAENGKATQVTVWVVHDADPSGGW